MCEVTASQSGNSNYASAASVTQSMSVGKLSQEISFAQPSSHSISETSVALSASASSGLPVALSVTAGNSQCSIDQWGIITFLTAGTCSVTASQAGDTTYSPASSVIRTFTITADTPSAPHIVSVSSGNGTVTVGYSAPFSDGGSPILEYTVSATSQFSSSISRNDCGIATQSCTLTGLMNGQSYSVTVSAINAAGKGASSDSAEVLIPAATLEAVQNVAGTRSTTSMDIRWEDPDSYGSGSFVRYEVYLRERGGTYSAPVTVQSLSVSRVLSPARAVNSSQLVRVLSTTSRTAHFDNLNPSSTYESKIVTITSTSTSESTSNTAQAVILPLNTPSVPRDLNFSSTTGTAARISWSAPETDGGQPLQTYVVTSAAGTCALASALATTCVIQNLQPGTAVDVQVVAKNAVGNSAAATVSATTPRTPYAPTITITSATSTSISATWTSGSNGGRPITSYQVTATSITDASDIGQCSTTALTCNIPGLKANITYDVRVRAINSVGAGSLSASYTIKTAVAVSSNWTVFRTSAEATIGPELLNQLPPAPARVSTQSLSGNKTKITAVRAAKDAAIPVTYALITIKTRQSNTLLARIKVQVDPADPTTTVTIPYASQKVRVTVQFANAVGVSAGGQTGINVSEGVTLEDTTIGGRARVVGQEIPTLVGFAKGSSALSANAKARLKSVARTLKNRAGLVYVTGFATPGELKSAWLLETLAQRRARVTAMYLSTLGVRQWITYSGTASAVAKWDPARVQRVAISTATLEE